MAAGSRIFQILKEFVKLRDFSFEGIFQPQKFARRRRLIEGLLKDVPKGKLTKQTKKDLIEEIADSIAQSPFIKPFREAEEERLRKLRGG